MAKAHPMHGIEGTHLSFSGT